MSTIARLSLDQYDQMIRCGVFDRGPRQRLEFIHGEMREMTPIGSEHEVIVDWLTEWSIDNLPKGKAWVRVQNSIGLTELESAPEPDLAWVSRRDFRRGRPTSEDVLLVIEVAESSLSYDRGEKADLYAEAGIADYWVVNVPARTIDVHRDPQDGRYRTVRSFAGSDELRPLCEPNLALRPAMLWES